jgi:hypothetical protein
MKMKQELIVALKKAFRLLKPRLDQRGVHCLYESDLRGFVMDGLFACDPSIQCFPEWSVSKQNKYKIDLYMEHPTDPKRRAAVEFKFYVTRARDNATGPKKGGPSRKNEDNFRECLEKLRKFKGHDEKLVVLAYETSNAQGRGNSYRKSYDDLGKFGIDPTDVDEISHCCSAKLICKLISIRS